MELVKHSYKDDCIFLLKDLTSVIREITVDEKEDLIRNGISYSEVISKESKPTLDTIKIFKSMLETSAKEIANYVGKISKQIYSDKKDNLVIVSLARGGTPYGILIKKYLKFRYNVDVPHYSISIIRGRGIDYNALKYILKNNKNAKIQFVDGWTGKGSIINELNKSISIFNEANKEEIDSSLAVIADPAKLCNLYGTREDVIIPNCCLNATVSGLISRTILNETYIGKEDFHGAKTLDYLKEEDLSQYFIDKIAEKFYKV
ncbi:MAG: cysteine protease StiP domain-containing protein, partial [Clostridium sp.]